jgi:RNA polymerase sigma factor (sigma-70 family)
MSKYDNDIARYRPTMVKAAVEALGDDGEDVVQDVILEVLSLRNPPENIEGLLFQYLRWRINDRIREAGQTVEILEADLGEVEEDGELRPAQLADLEDISAAQGGIPPWPTAVDPITPEHAALASEMRAIVNQIAVTAVGERDYAIFLAVSQDELPQWKVAKEFDIDQATVSRTVDRVRRVMAEQLRQAGYAL